MTLVPQLGQTPCRALLPFFNTTSLGSLISTVFFSFTQYAVGMRVLGETTLNTAAETHRQRNSPSHQITN